MADTIEIKNLLTGFKATANQSEYDSGVYDKSVWSPVYMAPVEDNSVIPVPNPSMPKTDSNSLTSDSLTPEPALNYASYNEPSVYDVSGLNVSPEMQMTAPEQEAQGFSDRLQQLNNQLLGESTFRSSQEEAQNMATLNQTQKDLEARLNVLKNENSSIPLLMQQQSEGRGITTGGLRPLETARLRENAIQALSTASMLEASRGNIATAQTLIDRAVAQKYGPVKEQIDVLTKNLQLIKDSPAYSLADKNRAAKQLEIQEAKKAEVAKQEENEKAILGVATEAAKFGVDAATLEKIRNAKDLTEATQIAQEAGVYTSSGEGFTLGSDQTRYDAQGNIIARGQKAEPTDMEIMKFEMDAAKTNAEIDKIYADMAKLDDPLEIEKKQLEIAKLRQDLATKKAEADKEQIANGQSAAVAKEKVSLINGLLNQTTLFGNDSLNKVVGTFKLGRMPIFSKLSGEAQKFAGGVQQLIAQETIDTLVNLKERGGTLGALSDQERMMLQNAATKLGSWEIKDDSGKGTGRWDIDEKSFRDELERIKSLTETATKNATGWQWLTIDEFLTDADDSQIEAADSLKRKYPSLSDDDLLELINEQSFNPVGGDTKPAPLSKIESVPNGESGGQCGRFVNKFTGLGLGDSYQSKMSKMDKSIKRPEPGMVFLMPYKGTGHTGFVVGVRGDKVIVKDSNYSLDGKVKTHEIPIAKITGLRRV